MIITNYFSIFRKNLILDTQIKLWYPRKKGVKKERIKRRIPGFLYLITITGTGLYKIGITQNIGKRISYLKTGNPFNLDIIHTYWSVDCAAIERFMHKEFAHKSYEREWFKLSLSDIDFIKRYQD